MNLKIEELREGLHRIIWNLKIIKENKKVGFVLRGLLITGIVAYFTIVGAYQAKTATATIQEGIANEVIRFHVIANSDTTEDQAVKMKVKDAVITALRPRMSESLDINVARKCLLENMEFIKKVAEETLIENGFNYEVNVSLGMETFPIKVYGDITLPAGAYEALCIRIGEAQGHNWWCIVFPTLCYVDETYSYVPDDSKERLKYVLTEEEYEAITTEDQKDQLDTTKKHVKEKDVIKIKVKSKLWDYIQKYL